MNEEAQIPTGYIPPEGLLRERVVLVTGAGQGLGRAVAMQAAQCGATVALLGRKQTKLESTYDAIATAGGAQPALIPMDLSAAGNAEYESLAQLLRKDLSQCMCHGGVVVVSATLRLGDDFIDQRQGFFMS